MSNFKEIYPQINFREDLHRMDSLGEDNYEVWAYNGNPDFAPLSADYSYELVKNIKTANGKDIIINDAIDMPLESFKLYGKTNPEYPDDYIRLEYIENRGSNAYIDTGVIADTTLTIEMDFQFLPDRAPGYNNPTGAISGTDGNYRIFHIHPGTQNQVGLQTYNADTTIIFQNYPYTTRAFTKIDMPNKTIITDIEGTRQSYDIIDRGDWTTNLNFWLFRRNGIEYPSALRIYSFIIYKNGEKIRDLIPVVRKSNNEVGMFDLVTQTYYAKKGNGTLYGSSVYNLSFVGKWNPSTNYYETKCFNQTGLNLITNASTISLETSTGASGTLSSPAFTFDPSLTVSNFAGKKVVMSFNAKSANVTSDSSSGRHRWGAEFSWKKTDNTTSYNGIWVELPDNFRKDGRYSQSFVIPSNWNGTISAKYFYAQRLATGEIKLWNMKLELGNKATPFSLNPADPNYQEPIKQAIYSPQPLASLPNGVKDYYDNGWLYLSTVYDYFRNTDNWQFDNIYSNNNVTVISLFLPNAKKDSTDIWCTHFKASEDLTQPNRIKIKDQRVYISADATECPNLDSFLRWMESGKVFICYERKNTLKVPSQPYVLLHTYDEQTEIINDQNAEMEIEYRVGPNARVWKKQEDGTFAELTS